MAKLDNTFSSLSTGVINKLNGATFLLSAIGLLADILGIGKVVYEVVVIGNLSDLGFKILVLFVVFIFGIGLGMVSLKGFGNLSIIQMGKFYAWLYIFLICLTYLGIAFVLRQHEYNVTTYTAFVVLIIAQLLAVKTIGSALENQIDTKQFSIPILSICLIHGILVVYTYVFTGISVTLYLGGDIFFFILMSFVGSSMLGDTGFLHMIGKIFSKEFVR